MGSGTSTTSRVVLWLLGIDDSAGPALSPRVALSQDKSSPGLLVASSGTPGWARGDSAGTALPGWCCGSKDSVDSGRRRGRPERSWSAWGSPRAFLAGKLCQRFRGGRAQWSQCPRQRRDFRRQARGLPARMREILYIGASLYETLFSVRTGKKIGQNK